MTISTMNVYSGIRPIQSMDNTGSRQKKQRSLYLGTKKSNKNKGMVVLPENSTFCICV